MRQLIGIRRYHDCHPVTREEFELEDRMYREPNDSFVLLTAGSLPGDPAVEQSYSLEGDLSGCENVQSRSNGR